MSLNLVFNRCIKERLPSLLSPCARADAARRFGQHFNFLHVLARQRRNKRLGAPLHATTTSASTQTAMQTETQLTALSPHGVHHPFGVT